MTISIITATIDGERSLDYTLGSVSSQTYRDIEHLVVDGYSTDRTADIVARYPGVRMISRDRMGVYDALNFGVANTSGEIFGFLHCNDALASDDVIEAVAKAFADDPDLDFVYGDLQYVSPSTHRLGRIYHAEAFESSQLLGGVCPPHPTLYIRRSTAERIGEYVEDYRICGDFDMWLRLFGDKSLRCRYLPMIMVNMSTGGLSTRLRSRLYTNNVEKLKALRRNGLPAKPLLLLHKYLIVARDYVSDFIRRK
ncbi:MAG: glycosyltransferase family 2 protein [Bacteroidales bacterium]|nr:glycosyltransferase family 2 protein [Bacteroidales bacterium]